ncbi:MAG: 1,4-dihydroxy-2-naphthoate polyprenyltransferase, partial [Actinomycetia bacterium]|nr:1,4-dihydroxy-2-naphthoate polyprenyltransferase [Actinomycetes bacterium]
VNNLRDVDTDRVTGKRTLAVRVGKAATQDLYTLCIVGALVATLMIGVLRPQALIALLAFALALSPVRVVRARSATPPTLIGALVATSRLELVVAALLAIGLKLA